MRLFKLVLVLAVLGFAALTGFAYFGDMTPDSTTVVEPVTLDAQ